MLIIGESQCQDQIDEFLIRNRSKPNLSKTENNKLLKIYSFKNNIVLKNKFINSSIRIFKKKLLFCEPLKTQSACSPYFIIPLYFIISLFTIFSTSFLNTKIFSEKSA